MIYHYSGDILDMLYIYKVQENQLKKAYHIMRIFRNMTVYNIVCEKTSKFTVHNQ